MVPIRILTLDIECSPAEADVWSLFGINVGISQVKQPGRMICFAATWYGEKSIEFWSEWDHSHEEMVRAAHKLVSEADVLVGYNSKGFDFKHMQREFLLLGLPPTPPIQHVDLYLVVKREFKFLSNKLDFVAQQLGLGAKLSHAGHSLWVQVLAGDPKAQRLMQRYNVQDVRITEKLYDKLLPWVRTHPNRNLWSDYGCCPNCGGTKLQSRGVRRTRVSVFQRYQCQSCGAWSSDGKSEGRADVR